MPDPLVSVVMPVYNEEGRVKRAIDSMRKQTYRNLEIIVVDDGSTDGTWGVVEQITKEDPRVSLHRVPKVAKRTNWRGYDINAGFAARNYGFKIAHGEWLTTQDADDASLANRVEAQYRLAIKHAATCVTIDWQQLRPELLDKSLDIEKIFAEQGEAAVVRPEETYCLSKRNRGILMIEPLHQFIPFSIKWFPYTRRLFFRHPDPFPGADNCFFFHRRVRDAGVYLRPRNQRTWGAASGRGSGRDFVFRVANQFKNSWSFRLPLYLWDVKAQNQAYAGYDKYLV